MCSREQDSDGQMGACGNDIPQLLSFSFLRALANLYEDPEWSQKDLAGPTELLRTQVTKSKLGALAPRQLWRYRQELAERARLGHPTCFTNLWALINEALLHDKVGRRVGPGLVKPRQSHLEVGPSLGDIWERLLASRRCGLRLSSFFPSAP